jgi:ubiquinone/menaquinone biosynthesis C-methylase UbiE
MSNGQDSISPACGWTTDTGADRKTTVLAAEIARVAKTEIRSILVVGCGSGRDARSLASYFRCPVTAVDLDDYFEPHEGYDVRFQQMDATELNLEDEGFDLVFSFHALEHIPDYRKAIGEMRRVLKSGGVYCIGTPNRQRFVGYVGVPGYSLKKKITANCRDWRMKLSGRFRNEFGAHAGFSRAELLDICAPIGRDLLFGAVPR